jgi:hypothetical protein
MKRGDFSVSGAGELALMCLVLLSGILTFSVQAAKLDELRMVDDEIP